MKDDYLWDKRGAPDPEIQHMERVLGQLRAKPDCQALMPALENLSRPRPRSFSKALVIAASLALAVLALGAFSIIQRQSKQQSGNAPVAMVRPAQSEPKIENAAPANLANVADATKQQDESAPLITVGGPAIRAKQRSQTEARRRNAVRSRETLLNEREQAEGLMAKEQLIKALQITSSKLNSVQKKVQGDERQGPSS